MTTVDRIAFLRQRAPSSLDQVGPLDVLRARSAASLTMVLQAMVEKA